MIKYEYKKPKGCDSKKFIENGHTMSEEDVLSRLNRLAHLENKLHNQANGGNTDSKALHIDSVTHRDLKMKIEELEAENKLLAFMVKNGLGEKDMLNDITYPHER